MLRQQRWTPDTCANSATGDACVLIEEWDDSLPEAERTHHFVRAEKLCSHHAARHGEDKPAAYAANRGENFRKNRVIAAIMEEYPALADNVEFSFTPERLLKIASRLRNLTTTQKNRIRTKLASLGLTASEVVLDE